ncbi:MAG: NUDIX hydrolase [Lachnospiraceae bacterium]|nr:NUDIX hydrolase [Lachnospiraceae bacterium]
MAEKRNADGLTEAEFLKAYRPGDYERPSVTVDVLLLRMKKDLSCLQTLLIRRRNHPYIGCWALPGGFLEIEESAYESACRELKEETGIDGIYLEQLYTMNQPDRDPRMRVIDVAYTGLIPYDEQKEAEAGDDAEDAGWFDITFSDDRIVLTGEERDVHIEYSLSEKTFPNGNIVIRNYVPSPVSEERLAFDHSEIVLEGLMKLRNKVLLSDCAFNLVPKEFTLPDLQKVYEIILGTDLYKANFRDKMASKIEALHYVAKPISGNRVANVYRYKQIGGTT